MSSSSPTINRFDGGLNDDSISQFDASINTGQPSSSEDIVPYTPSAQLTYQGRPMSQPKTPVFKLAETNLLDYVNNTSEKDLLTVVGVHKQDSESSMQPPSPGGLTWISLNKFATKQIVQAADDDWKTRPDVKRKEREGPARDHEIMKTTSLTDMRCNIPPKYVPEDPFEDPTGNLKSNALFPKRIDTFPTEESKLARAAHMKELRRLRKYKHGVPPDQRLLLLDRELAALMPLLDTNATTTATTTGTTIGKMRSFDTKDTELTLNINLDISPPSPMGIIPGFENDEASIHSRHSQDLVNKLVSPVLSTKRKPLVVKNIPEEKLGYYKRISNISITSSVPTSAVISDPSTAGTSENNSLASSRAGNSANVRPVLADTLRQTAIEEELMGRTRPLTNNPLQRYRYIFIYLNFPCDLSNMIYL